MAENGRSKLDVEVSYSSSNLPPGFSTAEFVNSKQEEPCLHPNVDHHHQQQVQQTDAIASQPAWSTKLRSVPLSIGFDVSVFATQDRHGRLTLHPVLKAADTNAMQSWQKQTTSFRDSTQGDLGRNNCANSSTIVHCPAFGRRQRRSKQIGDTDLSTDSRGSFSGLVADAASVDDAIPCEALNTAWPELPPRHMYMHLHDDAHSCNLPAASPAKGISAEPSRLDRQTAVSGVSQSDSIRQLRRHRASWTPSQQPQLCHGCKSALPECASQPGSQAEAEAVGHPSRSRRRHISVSSLARVVRKLEVLLDAVEQDRALSPASTSSNADSRRSHQCGCLAAAAAPVGIRCGEPNRIRCGDFHTCNNLDVTDLRFEYNSMHFRN